MCARLCGITVIAEDGAPATLLQALKRETAFFLDALFVGFVAARAMQGSPRRQRIGDQWARTMVVRLKALRPESRRSGWRFAEAALAGLAADEAIILGELL